jgi:hypothetical protein
MFVVTKRAKSNAKRAGFTTGCVITGLGLAAALLLSSSAHAQMSGANERAVTYTDYPGIRGKVAPLTWSALPKWMTFDMYLRGRLESQSSDDYVSGNEQTYVLTRVWGGLEVRPTSWLTGYVQFMDEHAPGEPAKYASANMRDTFDDRQAFLEFHKSFDKTKVTIIAGRQELRYGDERLVGISDWTNISRTWDGFLGRIGDKNRIDFFSSSVVTVHPTSLDKHGAGLNFDGAVGTITTWVPHTVLMPFVYIKAFPRVESQQLTYGTETEVTPGGEVSGTYPGGFNFDVLGALQRGSYSSDSIRSAAGIVKAGYTSQKIYWKPRLLGEYDYASGNPHNDPQRIGTFDQQYPSNHNAFGLTDIFGFQNIKQERINLDLTPTKPLTLLLQQEWLQASSTMDNVYNGAAATTVAAPIGGFRSDDIGREFDISGKYVIHQDWVINAGVGHFSPGALMKENAHGAPLTISYLALTYRFKVNHSNPTP